MQNKFVPRKQVLALTIASLFSGAGLAQTAPADTGATVIVTGTRVANRTALDTSAPVDIISAESLKNAGTTEITQALSIALPSLNFPRPGLSDGTDTVRPATLRGLAPDQTLVLVNSKRRHASALVNVNGTVGRGSASVDMNAIPSAIVRNIEVLRDGASAQYGSDAIAGVVNIRLRTDRSGGEATVTYGARVTDYDVRADVPPAGANYGAAPASRKRTDGQTATVSMWKGLPWGESGFVTIAAEYKDQAHTERSGYDMRPAYPKVNGAFDPREATFNRFDTWYGEPQMKQATLFANAANPLGDGLKLYGWASYQNRDAKSAANVRRAVQDTNNLAIYPDGFIPFIVPTVTDFAATAGVAKVMGDWDLDASLGYGKNKMQFDLENTLNRSLGNASKTAFDAGGFSYDQLVGNLSAVRSVAIDSLASPLNVALGAEVRREGYQLFAGEPDSYRSGGVPSAGGTVYAGAQGFPGYRPSDESNTHRTATGVFADFEANVTKQLLASFAVRGEHYSDYGNSLAGKLGGRFDFSPAFALRGSVQNGFRAPSPQQQHFSATSTNFIGGLPIDITTFRPTDPAAALLGAKPLHAEKSLNLSLGGVMRFGKSSLTVDAYRIKLRDRIVLSENLTETTVPGIVAFLKAGGFPGAGGGRFFINGVDTTTDGVDVVFNAPLNADGAGKFDLTLAANFNSTEVTKLPALAALSVFNPAPVLFGRVNKLTFEKGTPKNKLSANVNWKLGQWGATARATRYGEALNPGVTAAADLVMSAKTLVDLEARYAITSKATVAVGADNVFDVYPDAFPPAFNTTGAAMFSNYSPYGRSGRFVYARVNYSF